MTSFVLALVLLGLGLLAIALRKVYYYLPQKELKRQAEAGDELARVLWRAVAYGDGLRAYLWLWIGLTAAGGFVLLARVAPWPFGFVATLLVIWLGFAWFPSRIRLTGVEARLCKWLTPAIAWQLNYLHPVLERTLAPVVRRYPRDAHTSLYETADLLELLEKQQSQPDSRISLPELERAKRALMAHQYRVGEVLTPRDQVKTISDGDTIGLVLLDELHATGQSSFPVVAGNSDKIVGVLYLNDLNLKTEGRVRDYMEHSVRYLHEDDTLEQALQAFYKTKHQLFVVVNSFEEYLGIVTLEHIMKQLTGQAAQDGFDQHHDIAAVAGKHADENKPAPEPQVTDVTPEPEEVSVPEPDDEVAEVTEPEPESQLVTGEDDDFEEVVEEDDTPQATLEPAVGEMAEDEPAAVEEAEENPDNLAALDLPDEDEGLDDQVGKHVTFKKPDGKKPKTPEEEQ